MRTEIVYEDDAVLVVYKPAGLATQTANVGCGDVVNELKKYIRQTEIWAGKSVQSVPYLGVVHRLDQPVEGLLVFAKDPRAASGLSTQLRKQEEEAGFCKHYYAVLCGCSMETSGELEDYLCKKGGRAEIVECWPEGREVFDQDVAARTGKDREAEEAEKMQKKQDDLGHVVFERGTRAGEELRQLRKEQQTAHDSCRNKDGTIIKRKHPGKLTHPDARKAHLRYRIIQTVDASETVLADVRSETERLHLSSAQVVCNGIALAEIRLETGRFHQIRAQMAHGGMPLLGDLKYGNKGSIEVGRRLNVRNVALCAYRLEFMHPVTGRKMDFHINPRGEVFSLFSQF